MTLLVDTACHTLTAFGTPHRCAIGKGGAIAAADKREGDGATPLGSWPVLGALLRPDRMPAPATKLPWRWFRPTDGWSDDAADPAYNRPVNHPHPFSAERLWRDDHAYDIILLLGHNLSPPVPGAGSAIFWHVAQPDFRPTEGCVAIDRDTLAALLPRLEPGMALDIR
jgi:L,D-peptidoglycan transpeptidase YkuD (ErfK/YbiS/YcfS/YnhG family)